MVPGSPVPCGTVLWGSRLTEFVQPTEVARFLPATSCCWAYFNREVTYFCCVQSRMSRVWFFFGDPTSPTSLPSGTQLLLHPLPWVSQGVFLFSYLLHSTKSILILIYWGHDWAGPLITQSRVASWWRNKGQLNFEGDSGKSLLRMDVGLAASMGLEP